MARKIQTAFRGYRCRRSLLQLKRKKEEYEELMRKLEKDVRCGHIIIISTCYMHIQYISTG